MVDDAVADGAVAVTGGKRPTDPELANGYATNISKITLNVAQLPWPVHTDDSIQQSVVYRVRSASHEGGALLRAHGAV